MRSENSKTSEPHRFRLDLTDKINFKYPKKNMALANLTIYCTQENIKSEYNNNKFKSSSVTWNATFDLPGGSYSSSDTQDYFDKKKKKHETLTENPIQVYVNRINNKIIFKIKTDTIQNS